MSQMKRRRMRFVDLTSCREHLCHLHLTFAENESRLALAFSLRHPCREASISLISVSSLGSSCNLTWGTSAYLNNGSIFDAQESSKEMPVIVHG
jgi:hypothetical protein